MTSKGCPRQKLHSDFANGPWTQDGTGPVEEDEYETAGYFAMVSTAVDMPLWICEGSHRSVRMVSEDRVGDLGRVSVVRLVTVPPFSVIVVSGDTFHAGPAWNDGGSSSVYGAESMRYHMHFVKEGYSLPDGIHFLPEFKPRFLLPSAADTENIADLEMNIQCEESIPIAEADVQPTDSAQGRSSAGRPRPDARSASSGSDSDSEDYIRVAKKRKS